MMERTDLPSISKVAARVRMRAPARAREHALAPTGTRAGFLFPNWYLVSVAWEFVRDAGNNLVVGSW